MFLIVFFAVHAAVVILVIVMGLWLQKFVVTRGSYIAFNLLLLSLQALLMAGIMKWSFSRHWGVLRRSMGFRVKDFWALQANVWVKGR